MLKGDVPDQLHDEYGFSHPGAAEQTDFPTLGVGSHQVDYFNTGFQDFAGCDDFGEMGGGMVDGPAFFRDDLPGSVDGVSGDVGHASQGTAAYRNRNGCAGVNGGHAPGKAVGGLHGDTADFVVAQMLQNLQGKGCVFRGDHHSVENIGKGQVGEHDVHHRPVDAGDNAF